jgi:hypothetical protein
VAFWIIDHRKTKKGHAIDELLLIKLFNSNYARDLLYRLKVVVRGDIIGILIDDKEFR